MAEQTNIPDPNSPIQHTFTGGMVQDLLDSFVKDDTYRYARNATNVLPDGGTGGIHTEPSTVFCTAIPFTLIGAIPLTGSEWMLFFTNNVTSEIGIFNEALCKYTTLTGAQPCLNFNTSNLISGASRRSNDCGFDVYWSDGARNPDRFINTADVPWVQDCSATPPGSPCLICKDTTVLDCEKLRIAPRYKVPCLKLSKSQGSGLLSNGSYQVAIAYTINGIKCTDYMALSNVMGIWAHSGQAGALVLKISDAEIDQFDEMEVVVVSMVNFQTQAKRLGLYSTRETTIYIDNLNLELVTVPLELLPVSTPAIEKSDSMASIANYLVRIGPYTQPEFNYQPLANKIVANWVTIDYPEDYYHKGGSSVRDAAGNILTYPMNVGYMRDEVYAFFIRWVDTSGNKSASYHIPGLPTGTQFTYNIAGLPSIDDGGIVRAYGRFVGYSSTEKYPDNNPAVWGSLCGMPIMHHRFPDAVSVPVGWLNPPPGGGHPALAHFSEPFTTPQGTVSNYVRVMGVFFENIAPPVDNNGVVIPNIQGYEILRATRDGNASIIAKGMINNMRTYNLPGSGGLGMYQNYPYNDLTPDEFLTSDVALIEKGGLKKGGGALDGYKQDVFSFHSPDTVFDEPYLGEGQLKASMVLTGESYGHFLEPFGHPKFRILNDLDGILVTIVSTFLSIGPIITALAGEPFNYRLEAKEDLPVSQEFGLNGLGIIAGSTAPYAGAVGYNILLSLIFAPLKYFTIRQQLLDIIKGLLPLRQFATQYNSYGRYNAVVPLGGGGVISDIQDYQYIRGYMQYFAGASVNNLFRNKYVAIQTKQIMPAYQGEKSRFLISDLAGNTQWAPHGPLLSYYASYRTPRAAQYGQLDSVKQVPISCMFPVDVNSPAKFTSPIIFGGDTYINRYTEKNPFFYFNDWLKTGTINDFEYDYRNYINVAYPRFWVDNTNEFAVENFFTLPDRNRRLDYRQSSLFYVNRGYFYLFNNGIRDFFVESTVNVGYRDWEDLPSQQFYDPYGSSRDFIDIMFRSDIINSDILYKYDYSLSANRFVNQYISWSQVLPRYFDPNLAYTCYSYYPRRLNYSLGQDEESLKDNWRVFLPLNYKDFNSRVTTIKSIKKTGALILLEDDVPQMFTGVESIPSQSGTEYSTGDGKLFNQALQSVSNVDQSYEYGSCQSRLGVINTPYGLFWISQVAGKVFQYAEQLDDITRYGMKYWFSLYLPSKLLKAFPDYALKDNPVAGVGCQLVYDATNELIYICKKDYSVKKGMRVTYLNGEFYGGCPPGTSASGIDPVTGGLLCVDCVGGIKDCPGIKIKLGDPNFFDNASWTISYDPKIKKFISFHDWFPELTLGTKAHFISSYGKALWRHNNTSGSFCKFYNKDYPFAVEVAVNGQGAVNTIENIEYLMESFNYEPNQYDKFNLYDNGFNRLLITNPEQATLWMDAQLQPWNNPFATLNRPAVSPTGTFDVYYNKVENKYRFSNILDFTNDRGQFTFTLTQAIQTDSNGYSFILNPLYTNPNKAPLQRKKIRHYHNRIYLQRSVVGFNSMTLRYLQVNTTRSFR